ncbi:hypothetical protein O1611_g1276 [Lasiodiplodia mahajangana]|uniref:Uncharacterized protein n=1 Tax=Lasiodiplodia mahajangana TaxID=1108764 RepID=A0ACC2JXW8_9PEZI|nr:hypothetical protein O1611_g1276 [Lasiodiplodia mahajangana]
MADTSAVQRTCAAGNLWSEVKSRLSFGLACLESPGRCHANYEKLVTALSTPFGGLGLLIMIPDELTTLTHEESGTGIRM